MKTDLIITTYNWSCALDVVLESVRCQSRRPDNVIVVDDGSSDSTTKLLRKWTSELDLKHVWQKDDGFRAARSRNLGLLKSDSEHIIFIDGDCVLPPWFVDSHRELIKPGKIIAGSRVLSTAAETEKILSDDPSASFSWMFLDRKFKRMKFPLIRDFGRRNWKSVRTCNVGFLREDLLRAGGFNEKFRGWGLEDSELVLRLIRSGCSVRSGRFLSCVRHLYHQQRSDETTVANLTMFENAVADVTREEFFSCLKAL